ncbi:PilZ domain-containing protein [Aurantiacibacter odishensis]|uniref:PilZ domain-containing protein n=1 Tax=Aurantiacibacter odishensis TaxID=1155476 RepID=UPI0013C432DD|nr:PilZ domain-containing protein [Aurantiacibacter odishensis]
MLPRIASLDQSAFSLDRRSAKRRTLKLGFDTAERRGRTRVLIMDISTTGMKLQTSASFEIGEQIQLIVPEAGPVTATIVREAYSEIGWEFGAAFDEPITSAAVSAVLLAAPAFAPPIPDEDAKQWVREARARYPEPSPVSDLVLAVFAILALLIAGSFVYALGFLSPATG